jgi:uncharacterized tellurite resistance protein B-like protein
MIKYSFKEIDMWDKYRNESKQTICIIGVLTLSVKLCKADGHFSEQEESEILKIVPHEAQQKNILRKIIAEANNDINPIEHDARNLKSLLKDEHPEFLEFIIAVLYRLAHSDSVYSKSEDDDIREVAKIFGITKTTSEIILEFFSKILIKIKMLILKKEKINA